MTYAEDMIPYAVETDEDGKEVFRYLRGDELAAYEMRKEAFELVTP